MNTDELLSRLILALAMGRGEKKAADDLELLLLGGGGLPDLAKLTDNDVSVLLLELCRLVLWEAEREDDPIARDARKHLGEQTA